MRHGEQDDKLGPWMLEDPEMWVGIGAPIETDRCDCEARCECDER